MSLVNRAEWAHPVGAMLRIALCRVILIPAYIANILFHIVLDFVVNILAAKIRLFSYMTKNILLKTLPMGSEHPTAFYLCSFFASISLNSSCKCNIVWGKEYQKLELSSKTTAFVLKT